MIKVYQVGSSLYKKNCKDIDLIVINEDIFDFDIIKKDIESGKFETNEFVQWFNLNKKLSDIISKNFNYNYDIQVKNQKWFNETKKPFIELKNE